MSDPGRLYSADEVAELVGKSKSQVSRDAAGPNPKLATTFKMPGTNGARLFSAYDIKAAYFPAAPAEVEK